MKTDEEIKTDVYQYLKGSPLMKAVNGTLSKRKRPFNSRKEDVVISILSNDRAQIQQAFVNVNIYVSDQEEDGQFQENSSRLRVLEKKAEQVLSLHIGNDYRFELNAQRTLEVKGNNEHVINNRLLYKKVNE